MTGPPGRWPLLLALALAAAVVQGVSAFLGEPVASPNAASAIAVNLAAGHGYQVYGSDGLPPRAPYRAYHLPGEPFYLALGFLTLPSAAHQYLHLPVVVLLIVAAAAFAWRLGGRRSAIAAGVILCVDPFVAVHGPAWDDALLAAALLWTILWVAADLETGTPTPRSTPIMLAAIAVLAALAALTRAEAQLMLLSIGAGLAVIRVRPALRKTGVVMAAAVVVGVGAWAARNAIAIGVPIVGTTQFSKALFESNYRTARETIRRTGVAQDFDVSQLPSSFADLGWLNEVDAAEFFRREAWDYISAHPGDVLVTGVFKTAISLLGIQANLPLTSTRNLVPMLFNSVMIVAAAIGVWRWSRDAPLDDRRLLALTAASVIVWTLPGLMLGPVGLRYRMTFGVLVAIGAALNARTIVRPSGPIRQVSSNGEPVRPASSKARSSITTQA
jgi:hypothetical protein